MILKIFIDGGSKGNPGPAAIGIVFFVGKEKIFSYREDIGIATNNIAEYTALLKALKNIKNQILKIKNTYKISNIICYSDSLLLVNQLNGLFKVKNAKIREFILKIRILEQEIDILISYHFIPREKNKIADKLVNNLF